MNMKRFLGILTAAVLLTGILASCSSKSTSTSAAPSAFYAYAPTPYASAAPAYSAANDAEQGYAVPATGDFNTEEYDVLKENSFASVVNSPVSTFSADVDTASYCNVRRMIEDGCSLMDIPAGAVRTEEMLNYFTYDYNTPDSGAPFGMTAAIGTCPWNAENQLLVLGITTKDFDYEDIGGCNYVFLIDTSGSMNSDDKLGLLKKSMLELLDNLSDKDRISIVTYAGSTDVLARGVYGDDRDQLKDIIRGLGANGSTNGGAGIIEAYKLAQEYFITNGVNRIIMCSDGDLNVGLTSQSDLYDLVSEKRESGVYLSVLGFGTGNYSDSNMQTLADNGNGNYYYIDCVGEARKILCDELVSTLITVAEDVKFQIEFNPKYIQGYRQLGYENRQLQTEDFTNDKVDAGEVGSGCCLTVVYELVPAGADTAVGETELIYQATDLTAAADSDEWMTVSVRYKEPGENTSNPQEYKIGSWNVTAQPTGDWLFVSAICEFAMVLHDSQYKGSATLGSVLDLLRSLDLQSDPYKAEFVGLVKQLA
jgi:Ca-activated chloride channel family protein